MTYTLTESPIAVNTGEQETEVLIQVLSGRVCRFSSGSATLLSSPGGLHITTSDGVFRTRWRGMLYIAGDGVVNVEVIP